MPVAQFKKLWSEMNLSPMVDRILLNNTGDMYNHPERRGLFDVMKTEHHRYVVMTTNGGLMDELPPIDELIVSFNGGTKEAYERTTGLDFDRTVANVRALYPAIERLHNAEIHCLICDLNAGTEDALKTLWQDFPGGIRVSYKYDNQGGEDRTLPEHRTAARIPCDYLRILNILPDGTAALCPHDWDVTETFGNVFEDGLAGCYNHPRRVAKLREHLQGRYYGACGPCNYNTPAEGRVVYLKERRGK